MLKIIKITSAFVIFTAAFNANADITVLPGEIYTNDVELVNTGIILNEGEFNNLSVIDNQNSFTNSGAFVNDTGAVFDNYGAFSQANTLSTLPGFINNGTVTNYSTGLSVFSITAGVLTNNNLFTNNGLVDFVVTDEYAPTTRFENVGTFVNNSFVSYEQGVVVNNSGDYINNDITSIDGTEFNNSGYLENNSELVVTNFFSGSNASVLRNSNVLQNNGALTIGDIFGFGPKPVLENTGIINNGDINQFNPALAVYLGVAGVDLINGGTVNNVTFSTLSIAGAGRFINTESGVLNNGAMGLTGQDNAIVELRDGVLINSGIINNNGLIFERRLSTAIVVPQVMIQNEVNGVFNNGTIDPLLTYADSTSLARITLDNANLLNAGTFNNNRSTVVVENTASLINEGVFNNNQSVILLGTDAQLINSGVFNNSVGSRIDVGDVFSNSRNQTIINTGEMINNGLITDSQLGRVEPELVNSGLFVNSETGSVVLSTVNSTGNLVNNGGFSANTIRIEQGSLSGNGKIYTASPTYMDGISGPGDGLVITEFGTLAPGDGVGQMDIRGDVFFEVEGAYQLEFGFNEDILGSNFDVLNIDGNLQLAAHSDLYISFLDDIELDVNETYDFLFADNISGEFNIVNRVFSQNNTLFNFNIELIDGATQDFFRLTILDPNAPSPVPVPVAVWLFASGLISLVGVARRKRKH